MARASSIKELADSMSIQEFASRIDHTVLNPAASIEEVKRVLEKSRSIGFACVVISPYHVEKLRPLFRDLKIGTVIGFPMGFTTRDAKLHEMRRVLELGVDEVDVVANIQALKSGDLETVENEIRALVELGHSYGAVVKIIAETGLLSDEEKTRIAEIVARCGADFIKTCTGFLGGRATIHDVVLFKRVVGNRVKVKASGGIRKVIDALALLFFGADRLGTSAGLSLVEEFRKMKESGALIARSP